MFSNLKGFAPSDSYGLAVADMIVDGVVDVMSKVMKFAFEKDEETKVNVTCNMIYHPLGGISCKHEIQLLNTRSPKITNKLC